MDFQNYHRSRLQKYHVEHYARATKYIKTVQAQALKHKEREQRLASERDLFKTQLDKKTQAIQMLEQQVAKYKAEIEKLKRQARPSEPPAHKGTHRVGGLNTTTTFFAEKRVFNNLNGSTPISAPSMAGMPTSTPIDEETNVFGSKTNLILEDSPIVVAGGGKMLNTPALLGITQRPPRHLATPRGASFFNM